MGSLSLCISARMIVRRDGVIRVLIRTSLLLDEKIDTMIETYRGIRGSAEDMEVFSGFGKKME